MQSMSFVGARSVELRRVYAKRQISNICCNQFDYFGDEKSDIKVAVLDLGVKKNILRCLAERGIYLKIFPMNASYEDMCDWNPDGFFLSNGPGDTAAMTSVIDITNNIISFSIWPLLQYQYFQLIY